MASSHVLKKLMRSSLLTTIPFRQSPSSKLFTGTGFQFHTSAETSTSSFRTSKQFLRSIVPYRSQVAAGASLSPFINKKDFHVDIFDEDYGKVVAMKKDPKVPRAFAPFPTAIIYNGECLSILVFMSGMQHNRVSVSVEGNIFLCKGTTDGIPAVHVPHYPPIDFPDEKKQGSLANYVPLSLLPEEPHINVDLKVVLLKYWETHACWIRLPNKMYTPSDVEAKIKDSTVLVTFNNVTKEDVAPFIKLA